MPLYDDDAFIDLDRYRRILKRIAAETEGHGADLANWALEGYLEAVEPDPVGDKIESEQDRS